MKGVLIISCAKLTKPLLTGCFAGFKCNNCGEQLQASANARERIKSGAVVLCNRCAFKFMRLRQEAGHKDPMFLSEQAKHVLETYNIHENN